MKRKLTAQIKEKIILIAPNRTMKELVAIFKVSRQSIERLLKQKRVPHLKKRAGGRMLLSDDMDGEFFQEHERDNWLV